MKRHVKNKLLQQQQNKMYIQENEYKSKTPATDLLCQ